jgi:hypothetical protein
VNQLVNTEDGAAVRDVMIGSRFVMKDRELPGQNWPAIASRARNTTARLAQANGGARHAAKRLAPVVSNFCVGFGRCAHHLPRKLAAILNVIARSNSVRYLGNLGKGSGRWQVQ